MLGALITGAAILLSAAIAIGISVFQKTWATRAERTKATYEALREKQWDEDYITARGIFITETKKGPNGLVDAVKGEDAAALSDQNKLSIETAARSIMNDYEL